MQLSEVTWKMILTCLLTLFVVIECYNKFSTARKNTREEKAMANKPMDEMEERMSRAEQRIAALENRQDDNMRQIADVKEGQMALCAGVKALLEHELHNGNADEMEVSSKKLDHWLLNRP